MFAKGPVHCLQVLELASCKHHYVCPNLVLLGAGKHGISEKKLKVIVGEANHAVSFKSRYSTAFDKLSDKKPIW